MTGQPSITCSICERTSYSLKDIEHRYCGYCHKFHDQMIDEGLSRDTSPVDVRSILADSLLEKQYVTLDRRGHWSLLALAFPNGVRHSQRRPCEACGRHKRRRKAQFWVRWMNTHETLQGVALIACSFRCALWLAPRCVFPPDTYRS